jgi:hypothetical protein
MRSYFFAMLAGILLLPFPARAQDARIISDPLYLPLKGEIYGATVYTLSEPQGDNSKNGVQTGSFKSSNNLVTQTIAFGVTNDFTIRVAAGYGSNTRDSTAAATGDVTTGNSSGFTDPTVSATYRIVDGVRSPVIVDLGASYSPDVISATSSGGGQDGNLARGGSATGISLGLGHETRAFTIAGTVTSTYLGRQTTELLSNGTSTVSDAHWNYDVGVATQSRFTDRVSLNAGLDYATTGDYGVANAQTGNPRTSTGPNTTTLSLAFNYHFVPNRVVGAVTYSYANYSTSQNIFPKPASDTAVTNRFGNGVGVRLMYAFN